MLPEEQYLPAFELAQADFARRDPQAMAQATGVRYDQVRQVFHVRYLGAEYLVKYPEGEAATAGRKVHIARSTLLLHYLAGATGEPLSGKWISFREVPGGNDYFPVFNRDAVKPLLAVFGERPQALEEAARQAGGEPAGRADLAFVFHPLPGVPLALNFWSADEEFPASANFLFDATVSKNLPIYDLKVLAIEQGQQLIRLARESQAGKR